MDVGSSFRIYGDYFGWYVFNQIYTFFIVTGLWLIPFLFFLYQALVANQTDSKFNPRVALKTMEKFFYGSLVVFFLFLYPVIPAGKATFVYSDGLNTQTNGNTGTTYDQLAASMPTETVKIPTGWYAIMWITSGVNHFMRVILPKGLDARDLMYQHQQMAIDNPEIRNEFVAFEKHCLIPAHIRYNRIKGNYPNSKINFEFNLIELTATVENRYKVSPSYPGNLFYMNFLYGNNMCPDTDAGGINSTCIPKVGSPLTPQFSGYGQTSCKDWWGGSLKEKLQKDLVNYNGHRFNKDGYHRTYVNGVNLNDPDALNRLIFSKLGQANAKASERGLGEANDGDGAWGWVKQKVTAIFIAIGAFFLEFPTTAIKFLLPILLGASIMVMIILMPIFILATLYKPEKIMPLVILFFGVSFIPAIWHIAAWLDLVVLKLVWGDRSFIDGVTSLAHSLWNVFTLIMYVLFTKWWLTYLGSIGASAASGIADVMSSAREGANTMNKGVSNAKQIANAKK